MTTVDTRVPAEFHPLVFGETEDHIINEAARSFETAYNALIKLHDARKSTRGNPLLTESAIVLKLADLGEKTMTAVTKNVQHAYKILDHNIKEIDAELRSPWKDTPAPVNAEIRAHFKELNTEQRMELVRQAIGNNDVTTLRAVLGGPPYLSGLTPEMQEVLTVEANRMSNPEKFRRLKELEKAMSRVEAINVLIISGEVEKGIGAKWEKVKKLRAERERLEKAFGP